MPPRTSLLHAGTFALGFIALAVIICVQTPCLAQSGNVSSAIQEANLKAAQGRYVDALDQYQRIIESSGHELTPVEAPYRLLASLTGGLAMSVPWPSAHFRAARSICHERIASLPAAALKIYRDRVDPAAAKSLEEAQSRYSDVKLEYLVAEWFNSRPAEEAIFLLGRRAFERGDFEAAQRWWTLLIPGEAGHYPDPRRPLAEMQARLILLNLFRGEIEQARRDLKALRTKHADAVGLLAGREGKFVETLDELLKDPRRTTLPPLAEETTQWPTFAGWPSRNSFVGRGLPQTWPGPATWTTELSSFAPVRGEDKPAAADHPRALAFHPVIAQGRAFVADALNVYSFDLQTGQRSTVFDLTRTIQVAGIDGRLPSRSDVRYTLTVHENFLYVRLGAQVLRAPREEGEGLGQTEAASVIACLGPIPNRPTDAIPTAWVLRPPTAKADVAIFEGSPIVQQGLMYAVVWKQTGGSVVSSIVCYRLLGDAERPEILWSRDTNRPGFIPAGDGRARHDLLTFSGPNVVFCNHAGTIIALDARDGRPAWEYRYPRPERRLPPIGRDLCPCLFDGRHIVAAPADSDRLICLDALTGRLLWDREGVDVIHLLGVAQGRLIATFAGTMRGIRGFDLKSGSERAPLGWIQHDDGGEATFGRGFVSTDVIFWPTKNGLHFLHPEDGRPVRQPVPGMFGNLAFADGCFVAASSLDVSGYISENRRAAPRRNDEPRPVTEKLLLQKQQRAEMNALLAQVDAASKETSQWRKVLDRPATSPDGLISWHGEMRLAQTVARQELGETVVRPERVPEVKRSTPVAALRFPLVKHELATWVQPDRTLLPMLPGVEAEWSIGPRGLTSLRPGEGETHALDVSIGFRDGERLILLGDDFVRAVQIKSGVTEWSWRLASLPNPQILQEPRGSVPGKLSGFHRVGHTLYAILDESNILAIDLTDGTVHWSHPASSPKSLRGKSAPRFTPFFHAGRSKLVTQSSTGELRVLDARDGRVRFEIPSASLPWPHDPLALDDRRIVYAEGTAAVCCLDLETGRPCWRTPIERPSSLTGRAPALRAEGNLLLVGLERNIGMELEALDARTGRRLWSVAPYLGRSWVDLGRLAIGEREVFVPSPNGLLRIDRETGGVGQPIDFSNAGRGTWQARWESPYLLVHPTRPLPNRSANVDLFRRGAPTVPRIERVISNLYEVWKDRSFPLMVVDPRSGKIIQKLEFPTPGLYAEVRRNTDHLLVATGAGVWAAGGGDPKR